MTSQNKIQDRCQEEIILGNSFVIKSNSEGNKSSRNLQGSEDDEIYSDPGAESVISKWRSRKIKRRKPKSKEDFRVGIIRKWNEFYFGREKGKRNEGILREDGGACLKNTKSDWKVYIRRHKFEENRCFKSEKERRSSENYPSEFWQGFEEKITDPSQTTDTSSSENFDSDSEGLQVEEVDSDKEREAREEDGFEGMRFLLGSQEMELKVQSTFNGESVKNLELSEKQDIRLIGQQELEIDT